MTQPNDAEIRHHAPADRGTGRRTVAAIRPSLSFRAACDARSIVTCDGEAPLSTLRAGDRVLTRDNGLQVVRKVGARKLSATDLSRQPHLRAVRIRRGALGGGLPERDMLLPQCQRVLVPAGSALAGASGRPVLVAAQMLVGRPGIESAGPSAVTYRHPLFDADQTILSDGIWVECLQPAPRAGGDALGACRETLLALFPTLGDEAARLAGRAEGRERRRREAARTR